MRASARAAARHSPTRRRGGTSARWCRSSSPTSSARPRRPSASTGVRARDLAGYHARVREAFERHGGTVEKFIGDAVVAVFGAPVSHEDEPSGPSVPRSRFAIRAGGRSLRIGVNTGEALVTLDARRPRVRGWSPVTSSTPRPGSSPARPSTESWSAKARTARPRTRSSTARPSRSSRRGSPSRSPVWEAVARARGSAPIGRAPPASLVGREDEVTLLLDALARARRERSPALTLVGVPGIGKSRLVCELLRSSTTIPI